MLRSAIVTALLLGLLPPLAGLLAGLAAGAWWVEVLDRRRPR